MKKPKQEKGSNPGGAVALPEGEGAETVETPQAGRKLYSLRLKKNPRGPRKQLVKVGPGFVRLSLFGEGLDVAKVWLTPEDLEQLQKNSDFELRELAVEAEGPLNKPMTKRRIGPKIKPAANQPAEEAGAPEEKPAEGEAAGANDGDSTGTEGSGEGE